MQMRKINREKGYSIIVQFLHVHKDRLSVPRWQGFEERLDFYSVYQERKVIKRKGSCKYYLYKELYRNHFSLPHFIFTID